MCCIEHCVTESNNFLNCNYITTNAYTVILSILGDYLRRGWHGRIKYTSQTIDKHPRPQNDFIFIPYCMLRSGSDPRPKGSKAELLSYEIGLFVFMLVFIYLVICI